MTVFQSLELEELLATAHPLAGLHYDPADTRPLWLRFNLDFEHELSSTRGAYQPKRAVLELHSELAHAMRLLGDRNAAVMTAAPLPHKVGAAVKLAVPEGTSRPLPSPGQVRYVPWGWTRSTVAEAQRLSPDLKSPPLSTVKRIQDRAFSLSLEQELGLGLEGSSLIHDQGELVAALQRLTHPFVIKHPFGMAGRERVFSRAGSPALTSGALAWCLRHLNLGSHLVIEPWVERVRDLSTQWWIPQAGPVQRLGALEQLIGPGGVYRGARFGAISVPEALFQVGEQVAEAIQAQGYFGPVGMDSFEYYSRSADIKLRPLVEINARFTMGMCALGLQRLLSRAEIGTWLHLNGPPESDPTQAALLLAARPSSDASEWRQVGPEPGQTSENRRMTVFFRSSAG